jgi:hypothetical protein
MARTILLHAMAQWPGTITEEFWSFTPFAMCERSTMLHPKLLIPYQNGRLGAGLLYMWAIR